MAYTAVTALPYEHLERATAGLRAHIREQLLVDGIIDAPDRRRLTVTGPVVAPDYYGRP